jgi:hypothetical protein
MVEIERVVAEWRGLRGKRRKKASEVEKMRVE